MVPAFLLGMLAAVFMVRFPMAQAMQAAELQASPVPPPQFEVAEIKYVKIADPDAPPTYRFLRGGQVILHALTMMDLLSLGFNVRKNRIDDGPGWMGSDRFDVVAKAPESAGVPSDSTEAAERMSLMVRDLLVQRFKLVAHMENKQGNVYALEINKPTAKLKESTDKAPSNCRKTDRVDEKPLPPGTVRYDCRNVAMEMLASVLPRWAADYLDLPVVNLTSSSVEYDFTLIWSGRALVDGLTNGTIAPTGADTSESNTIFQAVQELGLSLSRKRHPLPHLVVDHIERLP
jgi:uncharacterized protein (TIGR03435 family)